MKLFLTFFFTILFCLNSFSQGGIDTSVNQNKISKEELIEMLNSKYQQEDDGFWRLRYKSGKVKSEGRMIKKHFLLARKKVVKNGIWRQYSEQGELIIIEYFDKGKLEETISVLH